MKAPMLLVLGIAFIFGALTSSIGGWWHPYATVLIKNVDQRSVAKIEVNFQNTEGKGVMDLYLNEPLKSGQQVDFHFYVESEGAVSIKAHFADSETVEGIAGYVELGDKKSVEIHNDGIRLTRRN